MLYRTLITAFLPLLAFIAMPIPAGAQVDEEIAAKVMADFKRGIDAPDIDEQVAVIYGLKPADCEKGVSLLLDVFRENEPVLCSVALQVLKDFGNPDSIRCMIDKGLQNRKDEVCMWAAPGPRVHEQRECRRRGAPCPEAPRQGEESRRRGILAALPGPHEVARGGARRPALYPGQVAGGSGSRRPTRCPRSSPRAPSPPCWDC